jgi:zinc transporter ZupT
VHGGVHPFRAVGFNLFTALVAFAGAVATLALGSRVANFGQLIMPAAAGSYVYIAVAIGRPVLTQGGALTNHDGRRRVMWLLSGFVLMGVSSLLAHSP